MTEQELIADHVESVAYYQDLARKASELAQGWRGDSDISDRYLFIIASQSAARRYKRARMCLNFVLSGNYSDFTETA